MVAMEEMADLAIINAERVTFNMSRTSMSIIFIKVVTNVIETNPDPKFIETVAETLSVEILSRYAVSRVDRSPFYKV